jgi:hypothetical protein
MRGYSRAFAAAAKVRPGQGKYIRARSRVSAGVVTVFTATCDNVVTPSRCQIAAGDCSAPHGFEVTQAKRSTPAVTRTDIDDAGDQMVAEVAQR